MNALHLRRTSALAVGCAVALTACSGSPTPDPGGSGLTGTLRYESGSVPPPYRYELTLDLTAEGYTLVWSGYGDEIGSTSGSPVDLDQARTILDESGLLDGDDGTQDCTGGSQAQLDLVVDGDEVRSQGGTCGGEGGAGDVVDAMRAIAGDDVVDDAITAVEDAG